MPDFRITIDVKNVAHDDIRSLARDILDEHGEAFDAARGEFNLRTSAREGQSGESYFAFDWEDPDDKPFE